MDTEERESMSEQKYIGIWRINDNGGLVAERQDDGTYQEVSVERALALLNAPPQPAGIVWRKPGEAGRVDGRDYLVWLQGGSASKWSWNYQDPHDGWEVDGVIAWAEINPPAWATGGAA